MAERKLSPTTRKKVASRAHFRCEYCKTPEDHAPGFFEVEHVLPISKSGTSTLDNLAYSCDGCNNFKSDKTASIDTVTGLPSILFNPRIDLWQEHFAWSTDSLQIIGLTPKGRTTVETLNLNRQPLMNLRKALFSIGLHPPI